VKDFRGESVGVGDRIEMHPASDLWMRGARFGSVVDVGRTTATVQLDKFKVGKFHKVHGHNLLVIEKATGRFPALRENPKKRKMVSLSKFGRHPTLKEVTGLEAVPGKPGLFRPVTRKRRGSHSIHKRRNPSKFDRCVEKVQSRRVRRGRKKLRNAYAICTAAGTRATNPAWFIHIQRGRGPVMLWNGRSFSNDSASGWAVPFSSPGSAMQKARWLLGKYHEKLRTYKVWVSDKIFGEMQEPRRVNPESLDAAAEKLENFTGMPATHVERVRSRSSQKTGWVLGELDLLGYRARREGIAGGREARYSHHFRKGSRPLLATSTDGKQLHIVGGRYEVTEAGVEDR
jgi:hypothetical protein